MDTRDLLRLIGTTYPFTPDIYSALGVLSSVGQRAFVLRHVLTHQLKPVRKYQRRSNPGKERELAAEMLFTGIQFALITDFSCAVLSERIDRYRCAEGRRWNGVHFRADECVELIRNGIDDCFVLIEPLDHDAEPQSFECEMTHHADAFVDLGIALALLHDIRINDFRLYIRGLNNMA